MSDGSIAAELLEILPLTAGSILQIGTDDALQAAATARNPRTSYHVAQPDALPSGGAFDAAVLAQPLHAYADPARLLLALRPLLADDGQLVLGASNPLHWSALAALMQGAGPAVVGHTLPALKQVLGQAGFATRKGRTHSGPADRAADAWLAALGDVAEKMGQDRQAFLARSLPRHTIVLAAKSERPSPALLHVRAAAFAVRLMDARTAQPSHHLNAVPDLMVSYAEKSHSLPALPQDTPKVFVIQRHVPASPEQWGERLAAAIRGGWLVVGEWDDHPDLIAAATNRADAENMWITITGAHAVQTSTDRLATEFRARNPEVKAFANTAFTLPPFAERGDGPPRIFYGAANRHRFSVPIAQALAPVLAAYPDVEFEVVHERPFFDALPTARKRFHPTLPYADYLAVMERCDIALMPLEGVGGEVFKSDIKFVEAGARALAVIASPTVYEGAVRDGENGLIARGIDDWAPALSRLLGDPDLRRSLGRAAWEEVRDSRMFADQAGLRRDWYRSLWERRDALNRSLLARFPAVAARLAHG